MSFRLFSRYAFEVLSRKARLRGAFSSVGQVLRPTPSVSPQGKNLLSEISHARPHYTLSTVGASRKALIVAFDNPIDIARQIPLVAGFIAAGFRPYVLMRSTDSLTRDLYSAIGVCDFVDFYEFCRTRDGLGSSRVAANASFSELQSWKWREIDIGRYAISRMMRRYRMSSARVDSREERRRLKTILSETMIHAAAAHRIIAEIEPDAVVVIDRGYPPHGPLFDVGLARGIAPYTFNGGHRSDAVMLRRYGTNDRHAHYASLSTDTWASLQTMNWEEGHWKRLSDEFTDLYTSQEWFGAVATQFHATIFNPDEVREYLGLDPKKKTAAIFPHIFWDASLWYGSDLLGDYCRWFVETVRQARLNERLNWIVKIHPANARKVGSGAASYSEAVVLSELGPLPDNFRILPPETPVSTISLLQVLDYCLTVRGTIGIEAACFGKTVLTGGTGRYEGLGFTVDSRDAEEYLARVASLDQQPSISLEQVELARRYAYGTFIARPLRLSSVRVRSPRKVHLPLEVEFVGSGNRLFDESEDVAQVADWILSGRRDFLNREAAQMLGFG